MTRQKLQWPIWIAFSIVIASVAYYGKSYLPQLKQDAPPKPSDKHGKSAIAVLAAAATQQDVPVYLTGLGTVTGLHTVTIRSRIDGELVKVNFKEGQMVRAGALLAEIDARAYKVQVQQAEGQLKRDTALLKNAETDLARYRTLLKQDSISAQQTATQESLVKQYQGTVAIDQAMLANATLQLSYTKIIAPISGRLGLRLVDQGNIVHINDVNGLAVISQTQPTSVIFTLPEDALPAVMQQFHAGKQLTVIAFDRSGNKKLAQGNLTAIDNQIDLNTGTVKLKSQFDNTDAALFANQFVNVKMLVNTLHSVVTVPAAAIQNGVSGAFVYVVKDDQTVSVRAVKLGAVDGEQVVIEDGLNADEWVVVDGADKLREGTPIKLINRDAPVPNKLGTIPLLKKDQVQTQRRDHAD
ncbi:multidrug efflux system, subunit A [Crenothrix polyspora]|uniref:Multidrug efflux system, subunit A n=1 Tax=Crenothrix polyspora TaxID=360316 RepID=A0A1R4HE92_9GAMM|nr:MdtA/MuxA family multidrug efflux RND transporter periplasmic adaptor subunit [Crenothrix polyspora]SJM94552.1 multidrug efflux system, subunit A [Crenothrix polyspora]